MFKKKIALNTLLIGGIVFSSTTYISISLNNYLHNSAVVSSNSVASPTDLSSFDFYTYDMGYIAASLLPSSSDGEGNTIYTNNYDEEVKSPEIQNVLVDLFIKKNTGSDDKKIPADNWQYLSLSLKVVDATETESTKIQIIVSPNLNKDPDSSYYTGSQTKDLTVNLAYPCAAADGVPLEKTKSITFESDNTAYTNAKDESLITQTITKTNISKNNTAGAYKPTFYNKTVSGAKLSVEFVEYKNDSSYPYFYTWDTTNVDTLVALDSSKGVNGLSTYDLTFTTSLIPKNVNDITGTYTGLTVNNFSTYDVAYNVKNKWKSATGNDGIHGILDDVFDLSSFSISVSNRIEGSSSTWENKVDITINGSASATTSLFYGNKKFESVPVNTGSQITKLNITAVTVESTSFVTVEAPNPNENYDTEADSRVEPQKLNTDIGQIADSDSGLQVQNKFTQANATLVEDWTGIIDSVTQNEQGVWKLKFTSTISNNPMYQFNTTSSPATSELVLSTTQKKDISEFFNTNEGYEFKDTVAAREGILSFIPTTDEQAQVLIKSLVKKYVPAIDVNELDFTHIIAGKTAPNYNEGSTKGVQTSYDMNFIPWITTSTGLSSDSSITDGNYYYCEIDTPYLQPKKDGTFAKVKQYLIFASASIENVKSLKCLGMTTDTPDLSVSGSVPKNLQTPKISATTEVSNISLFLFGDQTKTSKATLKLTAYDNTNTGSTYNYVAKQYNLTPVDATDVPSGDGNTEASGGFIITAAQYSSIYRGVSTYKVTTATGGSVTTKHNLSVLFETKLSLQQNVFLQGLPTESPTITKFDMVYKRPATDSLYGQLPTVTGWLRDIKGFFSLQENAILKTHEQYFNPNEVDVYANDGTGLTLIPKYDYNGNKTQNFTILTQADGGYEFYLYPTNSSISYTEAKLNDDAVPTVDKCVRIIVKTEKIEFAVGPIGSLFSAQLYNYVGENNPNNIIPEIDSSSLPGSSHAVDFNSLYYFLYSIIDPTAQYTDKDTKTNKYYTTLLPKIIDMSLSGGSFLYTPGQSSFQVKIVFAQSTDAQNYINARSAGNEYLTFHFKDISSTKVSSIATKYEYSLASNGTTGNSWNNYFTFAKNESSNYDILAGDYFYIKSNWYASATSGAGYFQWKFTIFDESGTLKVKVNLCNGGDELQIPSYVGGEIFKNNTPAVDVYRTISATQTKIGTMTINGAEGNAQIQIYSSPISTSNEVTSQFANHQLLSTPFLTLPDLTKNGYLDFVYAWEKQYSTVKTVVPWTALEFQTPTKTGTASYSMNNTTVEITYYTIILKVKSIGSYFYTKDTTVTLLFSVFSTGVPQA